MAAFQKALKVQQMMFLHNALCIYQFDKKHIKRF